MVRRVGLSTHNISGLHMSFDELSWRPVDQVLSKVWFLILEQQVRYWSAGASVQDLVWDRALGLTEMHTLG